MQKSAENFQLALRIPVCLESMTVSNDDIRANPLKQPGPEGLPRFFQIEAAHRCAVFEPHA
jgi:hypothetical protein